MDYYLGLDDIVPYLIKKKIIDSKCIVENDLEISYTAGRNNNFQILRKKSPSYILKQAESNEVSKKSLKKEAQLYFMMNNDNDFNSLKFIFPKFLFFDPALHILSTKYVKNSKSLYYYLLNDDVKKFQSLFAFFGKLMAKYHSNFTKFLNSPKFLIFTTTKPFTIPPPYPTSGIFQNSNLAVIEFHKIIQQYPELCKFLENPFHDWKNETIIHGDIRFSNLLISHIKNSSEHSIKLIDWEFSTTGDPAWDIGGVFQELVDLWLSFVSVNSHNERKDLVTSEKFSLSEIQSLLKSFWLEYVRYKHLKDNQINSLLDKSKRFCVARMIQTAIESINMQGKITNKALLMLQTSLNILNKPSSASKSLFGI